MKLGTYIMYNDELPEFRKMKKAYVTKLINSILIGAGGASLVRMNDYDDNHFRVIFKISYFQLTDGNDMPSKSQWNTLKKKMKRRDRSIFIFREYGSIECEGASEGNTCLYLDFGFLYG